MQAINPATLPTLLKDGLEAALLAALLRATLGVFAPADPSAAIALLRALPKVPRFALAACMLSATDKAALQDAWNTTAQHFASEEARAELCRSYVGIFG